MNCEPQSEGDYRKDEYEMQLHGFTANELFLYLRNSSEDTFNYLVDDLRNTLLDKNESATQEISAACESVIKVWQGASCGFYEELKEVVKQYFEIPSNVLLPEDKVHLLPYSAEDEKEVDKKLKELTKQLNTVRMMKQCLEQEKISLEKSIALEKQLSESGVLDSFNIDSHYYRRTIPSNIKHNMKMINLLDNNEKHDKGSEPGLDKEDNSK